MRCFNVICFPHGRCFIPNSSDMRYLIPCHLADDVVYKCILVCGVSLSMLVYTYFSALDALQGLGLRFCRGMTLFLVKLYIFSIFFRLEILCYTSPRG